MAATGNVTTIVLVSTNCASTQLNRTTTRESNVMPYGDEKKQEEETRLAEVAGNRKKLSKQRQNRIDKEIS